MLSIEHHRQRPTTSSGSIDDDDEEHRFRDIHALTPPPPPLPSAPAGRRRDQWETGSHGRSSSLSMGSDVASSENFTTMSREFNALVIAGSAINTETEQSASNNANGNNLAMIGEDDDGTPVEETNPLAIVPENNPLEEVGRSSSSPRRAGSSVSVSGSGGVVGPGDQVMVQRVKREEVEAKISAWQNAKVAKINNRFKREDAVIGGWESEQVHKSSSWMKKVERKLEEKRARALEKMQNDIAKARRRAEERRASAEAKRGTKVARVLEIANLMRAVGRAPAKRSFF
ncbi:remorin 4.1-like [Rhodamnia argentea]|uniref:Remorin 4.1-like n=1 Tax=Rhodamnia argentea TaxID=178133 RepID=A0A8B8N4N2_9MYRT|nr:remorin 4.1-like [Rhodamnia argentea]